MLGRRHAVDVADKPVRSAPRELPESPALARRWPLSIGPLRRNMADGGRLLRASLTEDHTPATSNTPVALRSASVVLVM
ncbi:unnamed protein product [Lota lota]